MRSILVLACLAPCPQEPASVPPSGIERPVFSRDGRLALSMAGDIWVLQKKGVGALAAGVTDVEWRQVTRHAADDRDPAWTGDGRSLVFASNRAGRFDLYRVALDGGVPERLTKASADDRQPSVAPNGSIVFCRGHRSQAKLMLRKADGEVARLTEGTGAEDGPAVAPDGKSVVYVTRRDREVQLRIHTLSPVADEAKDEKRDRLVLAGRRCELVAWSPDGSRLLFSERGRQPGVFITDREGRYTNLVSRSRAAAAFTADGEQLLLAGVPRREPGYNGDPDRLGDRQYGARRAADRVLWFMPAPRPPDAGRASLELPTPASVSHLARFEAVYRRLSRRLAEADRPRLGELAQTLRSQAKQAKTAAQLDEVVDALLRQRPQLRREARGRAAVSTAHPAATAAGVEILAKGGSVVDAAIAVSFALGVVEPDASGIGGYGEMLVFRAGMREPVCIEFMTRVPGGVAETQRRDGERPSGPQRVNVPGVVAGLELAFREHKGGKLSWKQLLAPAVRLAEDGFVVDDALATTLVRNQDRFSKSSGSQALFFPAGRPLRAGDRLKNPDLAWTLRQIAAEGADAFYRGAVAKKILADLRAHGSVLCADDLKNYFAVEREPVRATYRGHTVYSAAPPVTGGASLVGKLTLLEQAAQLGDYHRDAATLHAMIEAWKLAPATSGKIADPGVWPVDLAPFSDKAAARKRWQESFKEQQSLTPQDLDRLRKKKVAVAGGVDGVLDARLLTGTTAFAVADGAGNMVAVTQTLGTWGGNFHVSPGLGFLYNDKLRGPSRDPSKFGATLPNSRVGTVIAPTLLFRGTGTDKKPFVALGAAGNSWITAAVYQMVSGFIDHGLSPQQAIELPRFLVGSRRGSEVVVQVEDGFAPGVLQELSALGHSIQRISLRGELRMGYAAAVTVVEGVAVAGADPRRSGQAGAAH